MSQSNPVDMTSFAALRWLCDAGADEAVADLPVNRFRPVGTAPARPIQSTTVDQPVAIPRRLSPEPVQHQDNAGHATELARSCNSLDELRTALESFDGCTLKRQATTTVFADGTPDKRILIVGESPGRDEDLVGLPFVGRAGKLLDKMLAAIGLDRKTNVYITNVLNWRPPNNRDPSPEEAATCLPFLRRHIELVNPAIIILLGAVSARHVMGRTEGITRLRGNWLEYYVNSAMVPVMPVFHPAYLLRRPADKKLAWRDLQAIQVKIHALQLLEPEATRR